MSEPTILDAARAAVFAAKQMPDASGCVLWCASTNSEGYGQFRAGGRNRRAHRLAWELANGPIPSDRMVLHRCNNRRCVNVDHLYLGNAADNIRDAIQAGTHYAPCAGMTACKRGHPFTELTTGVGTSGLRYCKVCNRVKARERDRRYRARIGGKGEPVVRCNCYQYAGSSGVDKLNCPVHGRIGGKREK